MVKEGKYRSARGGSNTGSLSSKRKLFIHIPMGEDFNNKTDTQWRNQKPHVSTKHSTYFPIPHMV